VLRARGNLHHAIDGRRQREAKSRRVNFALQPAETINEGVPFGATRVIPEQR
jgi:hypothetical protein